jgi:quinoprotein glucose dehydrogenase
MAGNYLTASLIVASTAKSTDRWKKGHISMVSTVRKTPKLTAVVVGIFGLILLIGGVWLAMLGGSWYYLLAGGAWSGSAVWIWTGQRRGVWLFSATVAATLIWAFWEAGIDLWALAPRIGLPILIAAWLWTPWVQRRLH